MAISDSHRQALRRRDRRRMRTIASAITTAVAVGSIGVVADAESRPAPKILTEPAGRVSEAALEPGPAVVLRSVQVPEAISRAS